jgi:hypothetical protein
MPFEAQRCATVCWLGESKTNGESSPSGVQSDKGANNGGKDPKPRAHPTNLNPPKTVRNTAQGISCAGRSLNLSCGNRVLSSSQLYHGCGYEKPVTGVLGKY